MNWQELLTAVRDAYRNAPNSNLPISQSNYIAMLSAFGALVPLAKISDTYDTDFRRNLPGGGLSGLKVASLPQRIADAASCANTRPLYPSAGEGIAENIRAILELLAPGAEQGVLAPLQGTFQNILAGNL